MVTEEPERAFAVTLDVFAGPFSLLLSLIARRKQMAEDRIAAAEAGALAEVRAATAKAATAAAAALIAEKHDANADKALVDQAIASVAKG